MPISSRRASIALVCLLAVMSAAGCSADAADDSVTSSSFDSPSTHDDPAQTEASTESTGSGPSAVGAMPSAPAGSGPAPNTDVSPSLTDPTTNGTDPALSPEPPTDAPTPDTSSEPSSTPATGFVAASSPIDADLAARMTTSWRPGCPVPLADLRHVTVTYRGFDGADHPGELVVAAFVADDVISVFDSLYRAGYPISSMRLVDDFDGSDDASMAADNTSAFNCRATTGGTSFSEHSYGTAIDLNPVENPYVKGTTVLPDAGEAFVDRPDRSGVIHPGDEVVSAFADIGWSWGGSWSSPTDFQHFSRSGR